MFSYFIISLDYCLLVIRIFQLLCRQSLKDAPRSNILQNKAYVDFCNTVVTPLLYNILSFI